MQPSPFRQTLLDDAAEGTPGDLLPQGLSVSRLLLEEMAVRIEGEGRVGMPYLLRHSHRVVTEFGNKKGDETVPQRVAMDAFELGLLGCVV
jgi:hypothetical protein